MLQQFRPYRKTGLDLFFDSHLSPFISDLGRDTKRKSYGSVIPIDIEEKETFFILKADIPGVEPSRIEVKLERDLLSIETKLDHENNKTDENRFVFHERLNRTSKRVVKLPDNVDPDDITSFCKNGVLEISIPKAEKPRAKVIPVSV